MLTRGRLNKFIAKRCHHIRHQVSAFCATHDPEALHELRVETKKLRACLSLLPLGTHPIHPGTKGIKEVYKTAGQIRSAQINLELLEHLKLENDAFRQEQEKIIREASHAFCAHAQQYRHKVRKVEEHLQAATSDIKPRQVRAFFTERTAKLSLFFSAGTLDTAGLHQARKDVKELLYIHNLLPPALAASLGVNTKYLDTLQHKIGSWHDRAETLALLQSSGAADPALVSELEKAATTEVQEVQAFTFGFDQKISAPAADPANARS